jgi:hypothetical protein
MANVKSNTQTIFRRLAAIATVDDFAELNRVTNDPKAEIVQSGLEGVNILK